MLVVIVITVVNNESRAGCACAEGLGATEREAAKKVVFRRLTSEL